MYIQPVGISKGYSQTKDTKQIQFGKMPLDEAKKLLKGQKLEHDQAGHIVIVQGSSFRFRSLKFVCKLLIEKNNKIFKRTFEDIAKFYTKVKE